MSLKTESPAVSDLAAKLRQDGRGLREGGGEEGADPGRGGGEEDPGGAVPGGLQDWPAGRRQVLHQ